MADKNYEKTAKEILDAIGGKENVVVVHIVLRDLDLF